VRKRARLCSPSAGLSLSHTGPDALFPLHSPLFSLSYSLRFESKSSSVASVILSIDRGRSPVGAAHEGRGGGGARPGTEQEQSRMI